MMAMYVSEKSLICQNLTLYVHWAFMFFQFRFKILASNSAVLKLYYAYDAINTARGVPPSYPVVSHLRMSKTLSQTEE